MITLLLLLLLLLLLTVVVLFPGDLSAADSMAYSALASPRLMWPKAFEKNRSLKGSSIIDDDDDDDAEEEEEDSS